MTLKDKQTEKHVLTTDCVKYIHPLILDTLYIKGT